MGRVVKHLAFALLFCLFGTAAQAQGCGQTNPNCIVPDVQLCSTSNEQAANTKFTQCAIAAGIAANGAITALTGDGTATGPGSVPFTLATVNGNVGTFGSVTQCVTVTTNGKGLITAASASTCTPAAANVTGLGPAATATAGQIPGTTTNDNASAGNIGEYQTATASSIAQVSGTATDIVSKSLTAGDWDCTGDIQTNTAGNIGGGSAWISTTSATDPGFPNGGAYYTANVQASTNVRINVGTIRVSIASTTTVFLSTNFTYTVSNTDSALVRCRRMR